MKSRSLTLLAAAAAALTGATAAHAQVSYPDRPIRLVVGFPPGGPTDLVARVLAKRLSDELGQKVVVDNRPGANGNVAADTVAKADPDGYTALYGTSALAISPALYKKLTYDPVKDLEPVALTAVVPLVLEIATSVPASTVSDFIRYAKANPAKLTFASAGNGNVTHLGAILFNQVAGIEAAHAPYKGSAPAVQDLAGGQTQFMTDTVNSSLAFIRDNRVKALAVLGDKRSSVLPNVPTLAELGVKGMNVGAWQGILLPAKTPHAIVQQINTAANKALTSKEVVSALAAQGAEPLGSTPDEFKAYLSKETTRWAAAVKQSGASID
ncbi:tripartite tricarboxylate transporter substrate binding protein [Cupriavidus malaysiensis]|uniref:LacI family transcriptional regulator n=1 Tax=Cupriavidus malaysiensis TaxID=367825 RepID=A0ABM6FGT8_9BURK|nr:tripartite tricarboxylate transporter substrate binding protein [Cupriavidus malaysiensis]AOZ11171.1 LacI family transcriptional regulator [Cupriavidus malaysiensis]